MRLALQQAYKSLGNTKENPAVGCVIVKDDHIIGSASTGINGRPHAEFRAVNSCKENLKNSELYVTLEPCSHYGKTPPCVKTIIRKKIKRVFFSIKDPDLRSFDKSTKLLKKNKIDVKSGILKSYTKKFYKSYLKSKKEIFPFVTAKMAISKDFYTSNKRKKWVTNNFSRGRVHLMRSTHDCILTSVNTIISDNSKLTCRINGLENTSPTRIILDKNLKIPIKSYIVRTASRYNTIIFFNKINKKKLNFLKKLKIKLISTPLNEDGNFNLESVLIKVKLLGFSRIFLESGLNMTANFLDRGLVDVFQLFISSKKLNLDGFNSFESIMKIFLKKNKTTNEKVNLFGDKLISYRVK